jgi:hypothetical protein
MSKFVPLENEHRPVAVGLGVRFALGWSLGFVAAAIALTMKLI